MDGLSILVLGLLSPILQLLSLLALLGRRQQYRTRRASLKSVYLTIIPATIPWMTYIAFSYLILNLWTIVNTDWLIIAWAGLTIVNRVLLPITIGLALLPPYPPRVWLSSIYRLSTIGMAVAAGYMTQKIFPMAW